MATNLGEGKLFNPIKLHVKTYLIWHPARAEVLVNSVCVYIYIYIYIYIYNGGAWSIIVIVVGNGQCDPISNSRRSCLHFT